MMTFNQYAGKFETIPAGTAWHMGDVGEARGAEYRGGEPGVGNLEKGKIRQGIC
jgi:hypothetical protein